MEMLVNEVRVPGPPPVVRGPEVPASSGGGQGTPGLLLGPVPGAGVDRLDRGTGTGSVASGSAASAGLACDPHRALLDALEAAEQCREHQRLFAVVRGKIAELSGSGSAALAGYRGGIEVAINAVHAASVGVTDSLVECVRELTVDWGREGNFNHTPWSQTHGRGSGSGAVGQWDGDGAGGSGAGVTVSFVVPPGPRPK